VRVRVRHTIGPTGGLCRQATAPYLYASFQGSV
jgi:hypothetical protein